MQYKPQEIESKWQTRWEKAQLFKTPDNLEELRQKPKFYVLDMFPYPSGSGLHVGHPEGYTATDVLARFKRMQGYHVLHPMGWDAFGLPAERAAVREKIHPAIITKRNVDNFRRQIKRLGFSYDWDREISTASVDYYKWTQWIFLKLYEKDLAYLDEIPVNWCSALNTVLANEEVKDGKYVETGDPVERRSMKQWMLKITAYAERLLDDLDEVDWPESVKEMQRNWIGKSCGARIQFDISNHPVSFEVFSTRPDTLFGATYCVLAPEHPLIQDITSTTQRKAVEAYVQNTSQKSDLDRSDLAKTKTGVFTGAYAINPINQAMLPIWVADYVLMSYGTGAIMAVPAHDERDGEFAQQYQLPVIEVISDDVLKNSDFLNGMHTKEAHHTVIEYLETHAKGAAEVQYRLRDWLFSRQRYWGEPFPLIHLEDGQVVAVPDEWLPVELPQVEQYQPTEDGRPPLGRASKDWLEVTLPDGRKGIRELNTMPQWAGSCWYYLRYLDPKNPDQFCNEELEKYWMPVDLYIGGVEHAVLHLLYARFWHKVLYDCGMVSTKEPFQRLFNQGMILAYSYRDQHGKYYHPNTVQKQGSTFVTKDNAIPLSAQIEKMSKSKNNVVNPDDVMDEYGADSLRLYEMFMGPLEATKPWQTDGVEGVYRFLNRVWRLTHKTITDEPGESQMELWKGLHQCIKKVTHDTQNLHFNTAIAHMMSFVNQATQTDRLPQQSLELFLTILAPYAPHLAEELWEHLGHTDFIAAQLWPSYDETLCQENEVTIVVMINGKKRGDFQANKDTPQDQLKQQALTQSNIQHHLEGKTPKKIIVVPDKLVNIVL